MFLFILHANHSQMRIKLYLILPLILMLAHPCIGQQENNFKDCINAMHVCQDQYQFTNFNMSGEGVNQSEINSNFSCLGMSEQNSLWMKFRIEEAGLLGFNIIPSPDDFSSLDYDWALYDLTNHECVDIFTNPNLEVACNFSGSIFPTPTTGMNTLPGTPFLEPQNEYMINVSPGQEFVLLINVFSNSPFGETFAVDFSIGTCTFFGCSRLSGSVFQDDNENCIKDPNENLMGNVQLRLHNTDVNYSIITQADANGHFEFNYYEGGNAVLTPILPNDLFLSTCSETQLTLILGGNETLETAPDVGVKIIGEPCTRLQVQNEIPFLRRCFNVYRRVTVCNTGSLPVNEAIIHLTYDEDVIPTYSNLPYDVIEPNVYSFTLQNLQLLECREILLRDSTSCNVDVLNMGVACVNAQVISPLNNCPGANGNNQGNTLDIQLQMNCDQNSPKVSITNFGSETLSNQMELMIVTQQQLLYQGCPTVESGEDWTFDLPLNEESYLFMTAAENQLLNHSNRMLACPEFINPENNTLNIRRLNAEANNCTAIIGSYDPNDKQGFPKGIGEENLIPRNLELHYRIRFQNTGSDTAFTVIVRDTLSELLDHESVRLGSTSHTVEYHSQGRVLAFHFNNIMLPDSTTNEPGSIGYLNYYVKQKSNNPESYEILNNASIYFDFNDPIVTNTHKYTVRPFVSTSVQEVFGHLDFQIFPNPSSQVVKLTFNQDIQNVSLSLLDLSGRIINQHIAVQKDHYLDVSYLKAGIYLLRAESGKELIGTKKLIIQR